MTTIENKAKIEITADIARKQHEDCAFTPLHDNTIGLAVKGDKGYRETFIQEDSYMDATALADHGNKYLGLNNYDAVRIIMSSF